MDSFQSANVGFRTWMKWSCRLVLVLAAALLVLTFCEGVSHFASDALPGAVAISQSEVGLIFASIGKGLGVPSDSLFSAVVMMVIVSTLVTPPALRWSLFRQRQEAG